MLSIARSRGGTRVCASGAASQAGCNVVPLGWALGEIFEGRRLPRRAVALTFDDGYADNLTLAAPILLENSLPATFFLVPALMSRSEPCWWEMLGWAFSAGTRPRIEWQGADIDLTSTAARRRAYCEVSEVLKVRSHEGRSRAVTELVSLLMPDGSAPPSDLFFDWSGAQQLVNAGFDIGSHTTAHAILSQELTCAVAKDLVDSRAELSQRLRTTVDLLAYPNGRASDYNADTVAAADAAGYRFAVTTQEGWTTSKTPRYEVRRSVLYPNRGSLDIALALLDSWRAGD